MLLNNKIHFHSKLFSFFFFLLSSDIRSEGSIAIVKKIYFDFFMTFYSTSLAESKSVFLKNVCLCVSVWPSPIVEPKPIDRSRSNSISRVLL